MAGKSRKKGILIAVSLLLVFGGSFVALNYTKVMSTVRKTNVGDSTDSVVVDSRKTIPEIASDLERTGVIGDKDFFLSVAGSMGLTQQNIEPGLYSFREKMSYRNLVNSLRSGNNEIEVMVTFNNCKTIHDLAVKVSKDLMIDSTELESYILDDATLEKYDFTVETIPALFLPNSYKMFYDTDKEKFLSRMADEFKKFWTPERMAKLKKVGLDSPSQAVTLASVVYGEQSVNASEWPVIAGLYLNRLNTGMKLQSDPTFKFCWGDKLEGVQRLTYEHRSVDCLYNTYLYAGLPPGPISMPPTGCVDAVLNRDDNDYLYMCAQPNYDSKHNFTKDYAVHARNATEFQNWLANELKNQ
jgi:UPF0755 protein